jgi:integrase/recombinase XerD
MNDHQVEVRKSTLIISPTASGANPDRLESDNIRILAFLNQTSFSKSTKMSYERLLRAFFGFYYNYGLKEITDIHITLYLKSLNCSPATRNLNLMAISSLYSNLLKSGYIDKNPAAGLANEKVPDKMRSKILDFTQIERMIELESVSRNKILLKILYYTGVRITEALSLKSSCFRAANDGGAFMTVIGKGTKVRTIYVPDDIFTEISLYFKKVNLNHDDFIFQSEEKLPGLVSKAISRMQAFRIVKQAAKNAKVDPLPSPHWFRHSSATHAIENGAPIHVVQQSLGHSSIQTTSHYLHAAPTKSNANFLKRKSS